MIAVRSQISSWLVPTLDSKIECLFVALKLNDNSLVLLGGAYIPPNQQREVYSSFTETVLEKITSKKYHKIIIAGDFNIPDIDWGNSDISGTSPNAVEVLEMASVCQLSQCNYVFNSRGVLLDLVFCSDSTLTCNASTDSLLPPEVHHPALSFTLSTKSIPHQITDKIIYDFRRSDTTSIQKTLLESSNLIGNEGLSATEQFDTFCNRLSAIVKKYTPIKHKTSSFPKWFSKELIAKVITKKIFHKRYKQTFDDQDRLRFCQARDECKTLAQICYNNYISHVDEALKQNPRVFWSHFNTLKSSTSSPAKMSHDGNLAESPQTICNLFASYFSSVFSPPSSTSPSFDYDTDVCISSCTLSEIQVFKKLTRLDPFKGCGPDGIPPSVLKHCAPILAPVLTTLFNALLREGLFPDVLKTGFVIPIFKSGKSEDVSNYRPIVILSSIAKVFESLVLDQVSPAFMNVIEEEQHGFTTGRSTITNLLIFQDRVLGSFSRRNQLDAIYLDFSKAFDSISHSHLLIKLHGLGITGSLLNWFTSYLSNRSLVVRFNGAKSSPFTATSGVPQGSHLGPFMFNLFINDISKCIKSNFLLFADDIKLYNEINRPEDCLLLQKSLEAVNDWCKTNEMTLNVKKCHCMTFHLTKLPITFTYTIDDEILRRTNEVQDLGILFSSSLSPMAHINKICSKAYKMLGFIVRTSRDNFSITSLTTLYFSHVRQLLEYGSVVWSPYTRSACYLIERCQARFIRLLGVKMGFGYLEVPVSELGEFLNIPSLAERRTYFDLVFLYKMVNATIRSPYLLSKVDFKVSSRHTRSTELFSRHQYATSYLYHSPIPRMLRCGNSVPEDVDFFNDNIHRFKKKINKFCHKKSN